MTRMEALKTFLGTACALLLTACKQTASRASLAGASEPVPQASPSSDVSTAPLAVRSVSPIPHTATLAGAALSATTTSNPDLCPPTFSGNLDLTQFSPAPQELTVTAKCYGLPQSALFVFNLPKYMFNSNTLGTLNGYYLVRSDGSPIAYKVIDQGIDAQANGLLATQYLDHLPLNENSSLALVFSYNQEYCVSPVLGPFTFTYVFDKLPVSGLRQALSADKLANLDLVPIIASGDVQFLSGPFVSCDGSSQFNTANTLTACVLTDLLGNILAERGEDFSNFGGNPTFIAYKRTANAYSRVFFRLV